MEQQIRSLLEERGPSTGSEILEALGGDQFLLWRTCRFSGEFLVRSVGTRYLRLDRRVEGLARLSPSILREFLTYTVIGLGGDAAAVLSRAESISRHIQEVSRAKSELAHSIVSSMSSRVETEVPIRDHVCFILAGDIVYNMAHAVPRPERSTGKMVKGSDMDLVVLVDDRFPENLKNRLDDAIYHEKYRLLMTPHIREEIDYIVKYMARVREQTRLGDFKDLVACKILHEGTLLYGSETIFHEMKSLLRESGVTRKLLDMETKARLFRERAEQFLRTADLRQVRENESYLFYPVEESEEFE